MKFIRTIFIFFLLIVTTYAIADDQSTNTKPRIIATTDGEIDDRCSMVRFLLYANEWDIEGIIYCSSKFHWKGHNWAGEDWIERDLDLYASFYENLKQHDSTFPSPDELRQTVYVGNIKDVGSMDADTPGSNRIVDVLLDDEPGPVYLQAWGGTNTIARALWKIQHEHPEQMEKVSKKAIIFIILDQDKTFRDYIQPNWPKIQVLGSFRQFACVAYSWEKLIPDNFHPFFKGPWMKKHILNDHGPLCTRYEARNDGSFRSEGDSPAFMHQIDVGLGSLEHPTYGGWGGRFVKEDEKGNVWKGAKDDGNIDKPIWRWAEAFQNDWAARADWCVKSYQEANHNPVPVVNGVTGKEIVRMKANGGESIKLDAHGSTDPDGDNLEYNWWYYPGPSTYTGEVNITKANSQTATFHVPYDGQENEYHIILTVKDNGSPNLFAYRRMIVQSPAVVDNTNPSTSTNIKVEAKSESEVQIHWQKARDTDSGIRHYIVYRNGTPVSKTSSTLYTDTGLRESTKYTYQVSAVNGCLMEGDKTNPSIVKTQPDTHSPQIESVVGEGDQIFILFDEPIDRAIAKRIEHYSINNNSEITGVSISDNSHAVILSAANMKKGKTYTVSISGIYDKAKKPNSIVPNTKKSFVYFERKAIVRVGESDGESPMTLHGSIQRKSDGSLCLTEKAPWRWVAVGQENKPLSELDGLKSFTILGWLKATSLETGSGGNRIAFNLNYNRSGIDLVHLSDGRMRLAVNEWPDGVSNDSSQKRIQPGQWIFFAVTYDTSSSTNNVHWYFGDEENPAQFDRATNYSNGPTGNDSGPLTIGNYNKTIHQHGTDRQFRGCLKGITIFGSKHDSDGVLPLDEICLYQSCLQ